MRASRHAKADPPASGADAPRGPSARPAGQVAGFAATGLAAVAMVVAAGVAVDPATVGVGATVSAAAGVAATGETTTVAVEARDMRFTPATIAVPAGNRLVIELTNADDEDVHDLVLDTGADSGRLAPGETARVDAGVVGRDLDGWCSVIGHRQMGMVLTVDVTGAAPAGAAGTSGHGVHQHGPGADAADAVPGEPEEPTPATDSLDLMADPSPGWAARDAALPPLSSSRVHRRTFVVRDVEREVAPGVTQRLWTYDGTAPGPVLHGRVGDRFEITLMNRGSIGHSIDFHAGALAPQRPMRTIAPGESLTYRFRATRAGVWMYHCSTMPMSAHIANGLFGAVVIEPPHLPRADRSYVLVQSELYLGDQGGEVDATELAAGRPDLVVFNGYADQYDARPADRPRRRTGARVGPRRRPGPAELVPRGRGAVRHRLRRGRLPAASRTGRGAEPGPAAGPGRVRRARLPRGRRLPLRLAPDDRRRAGRPRTVPGRSLSRTPHPAARRRISALIAGTTSCRSPITAYVALVTIGASASVLMARMFLAEAQPAQCWIAPLIPQGM